MISNLPQLLGFNHKEWDHCLPSNLCCAQNASSGCSPKESKELGIALQEHKYLLYVSNPGLGMEGACGMQQLGAGCRLDCDIDGKFGHAGKKQDGAKVVLNGSDDNGNVLQGQEDVLEANRHWHESAFPQYLQSEKDDFCEEWDEALHASSMCYKDLPFCWSSSHRVKLVMQDPKSLPRSGIPSIAFTSIVALDDVMCGLSTKLDCWLLRWYHTKGWPQLKAYLTSVPLRA